MCNTGRLIALREGDDARDDLSCCAHVCNAATVVVAHKKAPAEMVHCAGENRFTDGIVIFIDFGQKAQIDVIVAGD